MLLGHPVYVIIVLFDFHIGFYIVFRQNNCHVQIVVFITSLTILNERVLFQNAVYSFVTILDIFVKIVKNNR